MTFSSLFFNILETVDSLFWSYIGFSLVCLSGLYFTIVSGFFQFRTLYRFKSVIKEVCDCGRSGTTGIHPLKLYFASIGGMVGLGNVVGVITALSIGGPGSLFWLWLASFSGMLIKYAEIYLGVRYRVPNANGGYDGGPMYYLNQAFGTQKLGKIFAFLLCIYGVEVYQFLVISDTLSLTLDVPKVSVVGALLLMVFYTALGGVNRLASICSALMPLFMVLYVGMCLWVILLNSAQLPDIFALVGRSAFCGQSAVGGFAGSTFLLAAQQGIARAVYSGDIGIGYDATLQAETRTQHPERQARLAIFALLTDSFICTLSMMVVLIAGLWYTPLGLQPSQLVAHALSLYFPFIPGFMALFFFLAGFTTIIAYFAVGLKSAHFLWQKWGKKIYFFYGLLSFGLFSFFEQNKVILIVSLSGGLLMMTNLAGILKLRKKIEFK